MEYTLCRGPCSQVAIRGSAVAWSASDEVLSLQRPLFGLILKILQLIQRPQLRGAEMFAAQLSGHLQKSGHEVMLVSLFSGSATLPFSGKHVCLERDKANRFLDWAGWKQLATIVRTFKPDVIQANAGDTLKFAVLSRLVFGWKTPLIFRNANKVSDFIDSGLKRAFNKFLVGHVSQVISVSEECRKDFVATYAFPESRTTMVPIGVEAAQSSRPPLPDDLATVFRSHQVILHVASFVPEKNHFGLLKIIERLVPRLDKVVCVMVGDGKLRAAVETEVRRRKLDRHVYLAGYRTDVPGIMAQASVLALPSLIEGLPGVILEAMQCGIPVVAYQVGGVGEVVINGETGWLVPARDEGAFEKALEEALTGNTRGRIVGKARQLVDSHFNNKDVAERFLAVYTHVVTN